MKYLAQALYAAGLAALLAMPGHAGSLDCVTLNTPPTLDGGILDSGALMDAGGGTTVLSTARIDYNAESCTSAAAISAWVNDGSGGATFDLAQGTGIYQPACGGSAGSWYVSFDGANDFMSSTFITPETDDKTACWVVGLHTSPTTPDFFTDGSVAASRKPMLENNGTYRIQNGAFLTSAATPSVSSYDIVCAHYNGATSTLRVNGVDVTGNINTVNAQFDGIQMGRKYNTVSQNAPMRLKRFVFFDGNSLTGAYDELVAEYGTPPIAF